MVCRTMKPRLSGTIIIQAFGRELARLRNHPEVAWGRAWDLTADDSVLDKHDEIKESRSPSTALPTNYV
jgi:hypothetical protein